MKIRLTVAPALLLAATLSLAAAAPTPKPKSTGSAGAATPASTRTPSSTTPKASSTDSAPAASAAPSSSPAPESDVYKIVIVGDSTAAIFDGNQEYHGWGEFVQQHFTDKVQIVDMAKKGRTAKSYIDQGGWKSALKEKPKMVLIQFGQNELLGALNDKSPGAMLTSVREYKKYLAAYVDTARKAGIQPVLLTPTHNFTFDAEGKPKDSLAPYIETVRQLADSRGVPMIDVHTALGRLYQALGPEKTAAFKAKPLDPVHFSKTGAWAVAAVVARELCNVDKKLETFSKPAEAPGIAAQ